MNAMTAGSKLNPNAPIFIPAALKCVEDFSPEWWELVKTTSWFRDHWFRQHQDQETFDGGDDDVDGEILNLLPDSIDIGIDDEFPSLEAGTEEPFAATTPKQQKLKPGFEIGAEAALRGLSVRSPRNGVTEPAKYREKPVQCQSPKFSPRRIIQQPR